MKGTLDNAFGYQGDAMNLPVSDLDAALPFYEKVLGFRVVSRSDTPHRSATLARDQVRIAPDAAFIVRPAGAVDIPLIARHLAAMF